MAMKLFISNSYTDLEEYITISSSALYFSASFMKKNGLLASRSVRFYICEEDNYKFGVEFSKDEKIEGGYQLMRTNKNGASAMTKAVAFTSGIKPLANLTKKGNGRARGKNRFEIRFDKQEKYYIFSIIPAFEHSCAREDMPEAVTGIYRYLNPKKQCIYIGKGNMRDRLKAPERREWEIAEVEYSIIKDKESMSKFEAFHLRQHEDQNGAKPKYNLIGGSQDLL